MLSFHFALSKEIKRLRQIVRVLTAHGLDSLLRSLNVKIPFWLSMRLKFTLSSEMPVEKRFRLALEELGPTFVKLGQMLANRPDVLPESFVLELDQLRDNVTPIDFEEFVVLLEIELGVKADTIFAEIDPTPLAAASLAQVHLAKLKSGEKVVIKLQRANVMQHVDADLRLLKRLANYLLWRHPSFKQFQPKAMIRQLAVAVREELDFRHELKNAKRYQAMFADNDKVVIPLFYEAYSTARLNVQQYIPGVPASKKSWLAQTDWDLTENAKTISAALVSMVLEHRRFHSDLHPGNVLILSGGRVGFVDFGSTGKLSKNRHRQILAFLESILTQNETMMADVLVEWNKQSGLDYDYLLVISDEFVSQYKNLNVSHNAFMSVINDFLHMLRHSDASLPADLILFFKTLMCLDRLLADCLHADFDFFQFIRPYIQPEIEKRRSPEYVIEEASETVSALLELRDETRSILKRFGRDLDAGKPFFKVDVPRMESVIRMLDKLTSRIALALIAAALVIGSAIINTVDKGRLILGLPAFGFFCFAVACLMGVWVIISILRGVRESKMDKLWNDDQ